MAAVSPSHSDPHRPSDLRVHTTTIAAAVLLAVVALAYLALI